MSSAHYIIVARNTETGELQLPLDDLTLYGDGGDPYEDLVRRCAQNYGPDWTIALYEPLGSFYFGSKK